jgi:tRNA uridine 5-carboxymethylaminomethyl modification enzyme
LAFPNVEFEDLIALNENLSDVNELTRRQIERDALYANYIERQQKDVESLKKDEAQPIPVDFDYQSIDSLSNELKTKLDQARPGNLLQASRIDGMTPAALALLLARIKRDAQKKTA